LHQTKSYLKKVCPNPLLYRKFASWPFSFKNTARINSCEHYLNEWWSALMRKKMNGIVII